MHFQSARAKMLGILQDSARQLSILSLPANLVPSGSILPRRFESGGGFA